MRIRDTHFAKPRLKEPEEFRLFYFEKSAFNFNHLQQYPHPQKSTLSSLDQAIFAYFQELAKSSCLNSGMPLADRIKSIAQLPCVDAAQEKTAISELEWTEEELHALLEIKHESRRQTWKSVAKKMHQLFKNKYRIYTPELCQLKHQNTPLFEGIYIRSASAMQGDFGHPWTKEEEEKITELYFIHSVKRSHWVNICYDMKKAFGEKYRIYTRNSCRQHCYKLGITPSLPERDKKKEAPQIFDETSGKKNTHN